MEVAVCGRKILCRVYLLIFTYIWLICMVNVGKSRYDVRGFYGNEGSRLSNFGTCFVTHFQVGESSSR